MSVSCPYCKSTSVREEPQQNTSDASFYFCKSCTKSFAVPTFWGRHRSWIGPLLSLGLGIGIGQSLDHFGHHHDHSGF